MRARLETVDFDIDKSTKISEKLRRDTSNLEIELAHKMKTRDESARQYSELESKLNDTVKAEKETKIKVKESTKSLNALTKERDQLQHSLLRLINEIEFMGTLKEKIIFMMGEKEKFETSDRSDADLDSLKESISARKVKIFSLSLEENEEYKSYLSELEAIQSEKEAQAHRLEILQSDIARLEEQVISDESNLKEKASTIDHNEEEIRRLQTEIKEYDTQSQEIEVQINSMSNPEKLKLEKKTLEDELSDLKLKIESKVEKQKEKEEKLRSLKLELHDLKLHDNRDSRSGRKDENSATDLQQLLNVNKVLKQERKSLKRSVSEADASFVKDRKMKDEVYEATKKELTSKLSIISRSNEERVQTKHADYADTTVNCLKRSWSSEMPTQPTEEKQNSPIRTRSRPMPNYISSPQRLSAFSTARGQELTISEDSWAKGAVLLSRNFPTEHELAETQTQELLEGRLDQLNKGLPKNTTKIETQSDGKKKCLRMS